MASWSPPGRPSAREPSGRSRCSTGWHAFCRSAKDRAGQSDHGRFVGKDAHHAGRCLTLCVDPVPRVGRPHLGSDGPYVAFDSRAPNLVASGTSHVIDVFVRDRVAHVTSRVSVGPRRLREELVELGDGVRHRHRDAVECDGTGHPRPPPRPSHATRPSLAGSRPRRTRSWTGTPTAYGVSHARRPYRVEDAHRRKRIPCGTF